MSNNEVCCPRFDPVPWDGQEIQWKEKRFVKDRVISFVHIPLNFGTVMTRNMSRIEAAGALADTNVILSDENSLWGTDVYIEVAKDIPGVQMASISGIFLCRVFEGPYRDIRKWIAEMEDFVRSKGKVIQRLFFYYTTCPKCAKKYGKNYVVILAQI